jgi:hypothetical protein
LWEVRGTASLVPPAGAMSCTPPRRTSSRLPKPSVSASAGATWSRQRSATLHGTYAPGNVVLRPEILGVGQRALATVHPGARFQYVFHGSSGSSSQELADAVSFGVVNVNVDTDNQYAFTRALADHVLDH